MSFNSPIQTMNRSVPVVRIAALVVIMITAAMVYVRHQNQILLNACANGIDDPEAALVACTEAQSAMVVPIPQHVSLIHRHRMRAYMLLGDAEGVLREVDLAIAADPTSEVPWQWKAWYFARAENYQAAMVAIEAALKIAPENDYSIQMKRKLLLAMGSVDEVNG